MSDCILVATRKESSRSRAERTAGVERVSFVGQTATLTLADPRDGCWYAALDLGHFGTKLHRSEDRGGSWHEVAVPVYPPFTDEDRQRQADAGRRRAADFRRSRRFGSLTPGGADEPGTIWAGTIPGGLFRSRDRGDSWEMIESLWSRDDRWRWFGGGKDSPGIHSVAVDPRDSQHITIAISCGGVWTTFDGGETWEARTEGMRAEYMPPELAYEPNAQDPHRLVQSPTEPDVWWVQHHNGIFRTVNGGQQWTEFTDVSPSVFGFAVAVHPTNAQTAWFVPAVKDECRVPVDAKLVVNRTTDGGATFETLSTGLPGSHCYDIVFRHSLDVDGSGTRLVMGSSTGSLWVSEDSGDSWRTVSNHLPPIYSARFVN
ncbi:MAG: hypothetical protein R3B96_08955 [Pirellulaceae bacterium]